MEDMPENQTKLVNYLYKLVTVVEGDPKALFSLAITPRFANPSARAGYDTRSIF